MFIEYKCKLLPLSFYCPLEQAFLAHPLNEAMKNRKKKFRLAISG